MATTKKAAQPANDNTPKMRAGEGATPPNPAMPDAPQTAEQPGATEEPPAEPGAAVDPGEAGYYAVTTAADQLAADEPGTDPDYEALNPDDLTEAQKAEALELTPELLDMLSRLVEQYPQEVAFHFTSDGQPFLNANLAEAQAHQKTTEPGTPVTTINLQDLISSLYATS